ncbi:hypothetical protein Golax_004853 [Gossypium laxum]|uniref:Uncharacterized protein n=3 Tax=Gossypium TaxID=3633 RepID=A0A7J8S142_GOSDV|nr:hypothetical protein [Gossypium davidsonii]MBA0688045.1 hypothetical protein [Gossypium aridum]MBA0717004.1 hypothetical protein [Gossypium laxum]
MESHPSTTMETTKEFQVRQSHCRLNMKVKDSVISQTGCQNLQKK